MARSARGHERAHVAAIDQLAKSYAPKIARVLRGLIDMQRVRRHIEAEQRSVQKAPSVDAYQRALAAIRDAANRPAPDFEDVLQDLYRHSYVSGAINAQETIPGDIGITFDLSDWRSVSELLGTDGGRGLQAMLDNAGITIQSIEDTYIDRLARTLADGLESGAGMSAIANSIEELLIDPDRADMIARTETNRAQTQAALDEYRNAGMGGKQVITSGDDTVCPDCQENEDAGPIALDDDFPNGEPPTHPNCECAVVPVLASELELMQKFERAASIDKNATDAKINGAVMIGWFMPPDVADALALPNGESADELHITLVYFGKQAELAEDVPARLCDLLLPFCEDEEQLVGKIAGAGRFASADPQGEPIVALPDVPGLTELRARLVRRLDLERIPYRREHGFTPHITVAYAMPHESGPDDLPPPLPIEIDRLCVTVGGERYECKMRPVTI